MYELAINVAAKSFESIKKIMIEELITTKKEGIKINDLIDIIINSLTAIDINVLGLTKNIFEEVSGKRIDNNKLIDTYLEVLSLKIKELELHFQKKKMN